MGVGPWKWPCLALVAQPAAGAGALPRGSGRKVTSGQERCLTLPKASSQQYVPQQAGRAGIPWCALKGREQKRRRWWKATHAVESHPPMRVWYEEGDERERERDAPIAPAEAPADLGAASLAASSSSMDRSESVRARIISCRSSRCSATRPVRAICHPPPLSPASAICRHRCDLVPHPHGGPECRGVVDAVPL